MNALAEIAELLHHHCGWGAEQSGQAALHKAVERRSAASGRRSPEEYLAFLRESPEELAALVETLVVPETFFFRYPESFAALTQWAQHREPLRILSMACSTGEEPYSIAMSLLDAGLSKFTLEAWDISAGAIAAAKRGIYTANAFREPNGDWRERHFQRQGEGWEVAEAIRRRVVFRQANILELGDPGAWDVIFCRNVLIYFSVSQQRHAIERLGCALAADGLLFLGPAEPPVLLAYGWQSFRHPMSFSCVKGSESVPQATPRPMARKPVFLRPLRQKPVPFSSVPARDVVSGERPAAAGDPVEEARKLADAGHFDKAHALLSAAAQILPETAEIHFLRGVIEEARGRADLAEINYRKALYLDPEHAETLQHMALLLESQGRVKAAENLRRRAVSHAEPS